MQIPEYCIYIGSNLIIGRIGLKKVKSARTVLKEYRQKLGPDESEKREFVDSVLRQAADQNLINYYDVWVRYSYSCDA